MFDLQYNRRKEWRIRWDEKEVSEVEGPSDEKEEALEEEGLWEDSVEDHLREKEGKLWKVRGNPSRGRGIK